MSDGVCVLILAFIVPACAGIILLRRRDINPEKRLDWLSQAAEEMRNSQLAPWIDWTKSESALLSIGSRLGRAGFLSRKQQQRARLIRVILLAAPPVSGAWLGWHAGSAAAFLICALLGFYLGLALWLAYLRRCTNEFLREIYFQLPIALESIILLVESGLGVLPSIQRITSGTTLKREPNAVRLLLRLVYELSAHGIPLGHALAMVAEASDVKVLRHVLLHLDISGTEGGELIPSLRSLAEHAHTEWRLSVETRVRRLENLVVFPVFASVIGLMLLTAAVPIVPVIELTGKMRSSQVSSRSQAAESVVSGNGEGGLPQ